MSSPQDAPVQRRRLRQELRRARINAGFTQRDVAEAMEWSLSKLMRIESGAVGISTIDLRALLQHYDIKDPAEVDRILAMARASRDRRAWWTAYRDITSPPYLTFLSYENSAAIIQVFNQLLVPGLLQDEEYARAVIRALAGSASHDRVEQLVQLRMRRQEELFGRPDPPEMLFVIDEAVLHRWVGGRDVMRHQLRRLKEEAQRPNVTLEIVPYSVGAHAGLQGPFVILEFADDQDEDVLYLEDPRGSVISRDEQQEIASYREILANLRDLAKGDNFESLIDNALKRMA
jgi:transcriptional regulator with XRE-family HTH domain